MAAAEPVCRFGATVDRGSVGFTQNTAWGYINPDHTITDVPAWQDGSTTNPVDSRVNLHGATPNWSLYFTDTMPLLSTLNVTVSGRYNQSTIDNTDRLNPIAGPGSLTGNNVYRRFNPSIGLTWSPVPPGQRICAVLAGQPRAHVDRTGAASDPANPCSLPNALQSDPPLQQVVTDTWEVGRARQARRVSFIHGLRWNVGLFQSTNHNDILFVSSVALGTGYFQNFAKTLREGWDASLDGRIGHVRVSQWGLELHIPPSATYQTDAVLDGAANNTSDSALAGTPGLDGNIYVHPGNRIPLIPKQSGKAYAEYQDTKRLAFELNEIAIFEFLRARQ